MDTGVSRSVATSGELRGAEVLMQNRADVFLLDRVEDLPGSLTFGDRLDSIGLEIRHV